MLTLTRRHGDRLIFTLPDGRKAFIDLRIHQGRIRLNCDFPDDVQIVREEAINKTPRPETCKG